MNPSTEDMLTAIDHVNADYIYILPNNKNIVMAANQARDLTEDKDINKNNNGNSDAGSDQMCKDRSGDLCCP